MQTPVMVRKRWEKNKSWYKRRRQNIRISIFFWDQIFASNVNRVHSAKSTKEGVGSIKPSTILVNIEKTDIVNRQKASATCFLLIHFYAKIYWSTCRRRHLPKVLYNCTKLKPMWLSNKLLKHKTMSVFSIYHHYHHQFKFIMFVY